MEALVHSPTVDELVSDADLIVRGRLQFDGTTKETFTIGPDGETAALVVSYVRVIPTQAIKGTVGEDVVVRLFGGMYGGYAYVDPDAPRISKDEDVILFLRRSTDVRYGTGGAVYMLAHDRNGKFSVKTDDGQASVSQPRANLRLGLSLGGQATLPLDEFLTEIRAIDRKGEGGE